MEGLEGLEALGNVGAVPLIVFFTQLIKKRIGDFKYGSDVLALLLSFVLCTGWEFYGMSPEEFEVWSNGTALDFFKHGIDQLITGFATWLAASKIYDLGHGNKKRDVKVKEVLLAKKELEQKLIVLETGPEDGEEHEETVEEDDLASRLRQVLEEGR